MTKSQRLLAAGSLSVAMLATTGTVALAQGSHHRRLTLTVSKSTVKPGEHDVFTGKLRSGKRGVEIDLAVKQGDQWLDIASTTTHRHGTYRFRQTAPQQTGTYKFFAHNLVKDYKVTAKSRKIEVTVAD